MTILVFSSRISSFSFGISALLLGSFEYIVLLNDLLEGMDIVTFIIIIQELLNKTVSGILIS